MPIRRRLPLAPFTRIRYKRGLVSATATHYTQVTLHRLAVIAAVFLVLGAGLGACSRKIGDGCSSNADCDPSGGTRTCDLSQPGGYCVVEGCDARSCPEDSFCVRFLPEPFLTKACAVGGDCASCSVDEDCTPYPGTFCSAERCVPKCISDADCDSDELCLKDSGLCARRSWEKRVCVQSCGGNGDCRGGYQCLSTGMGPPTGVGGTVALTLIRDQKAKFCSPAD